MWKLHFLRTALFVHGYGVVRRRLKRMVFRIGGSVIPCERLEASILMLYHKLCMERVFRVCL